MSTGSPIWEAWQALIKGGRGNLRRRPATSSKLTPSSTYQPTEARPSTPVTRAEPIRMCRKRPFATHRQRPRPARAAVCRIPCLILCLAYVERVCQCRGARHQRGPKTRPLVILW